ncbi:MAG: type II secretion system protein [Candidatus Pacebacteria bacterium]|nr:type II secretion system protein [Candidatus Paceibacterota bacterium]
MKAGFKKILRDENGLTMIELMTSIAIIVILSAIVFGNYNTGNNSQALERAAQKLQLDLRRTGEMAISGQSGALTKAVGIYFNKTAGNEHKYLIYKDTHGDYLYIPPPGDEVLETITIERGVKICNLIDDGSSANNLSVAYRPPAPAVYIGVAAASSTGDDASIILSLDDNTTCTGKIKTVKINNIGRVDIVE